MAGLALPGADDFVFVTTLLADMNIIRVSVGEYISYLVATVTPVIRSIIVFYVIMWGFAYMRGIVEKPATDTFVRFLKINLVIWMATEAGMNITDITDVVWTIPNEMVSGLDPLTSWFNAIIPGWGAGSSDIILTMILGVMSYIADFGQSMATGDANVLQNSSALGLFAFGGGLSGLAFALIMVCKVSLAVLLAMSPVFIVAILFEKTKPFFDSWLNAMVTFMLTLVLLYLTIFMIFPLLLKTILVYYIYAQAQGGVLETKQAFQLMILLGIYFAVIKQVPSTAASIARGYSANASGKWDYWDRTNEHSGNRNQQNPGQTARQSGQ